jgi:hypothetical protein
MEEVSVDVARNATKGLRRPTRLKYSAYKPYEQKQEQEQVREQGRYRNALKPWKKTYVKERPKRDKPDMVFDIPGDTSAASTPSVSKKTENDSGLKKRRPRVANPEMVFDVPMPIPVPILCVTSTDEEQGPGPNQEPQQSQIHWIPNGTVEQARARERQARGAHTAPFANECNWDADIY